MDSFEQKLLEHRLFYRFYPGAAKANESIPLQQIIKSLVLVDDQAKPVIALIPGHKKADFQKIKQLLNLKDVKLASPEQVKAFTGFGVGEVAPIFNNIDRVIADSEIKKFDRVWAGSGKIDRLVELKTEDIIRLSKPIFADISK